jgi:hypothetical protein
MNWRRGSNQKFQKLIDTDSEVTLIPRDTKGHHDLPVKVENYRDKLLMEF